MKKLLVFEHAYKELTFIVVEMRREE